MTNSISAFQYSKEALNVKALFHNKKWMVYVEGVDDIPFWSEIFDDITSDFKIEEVGGYENLVPYMDKICDGDSYMIVACDRDYSDYIESPKYDHKFIIMTYGYSIENTMYCKYNINNKIKRLSRTTKDFFAEIENWYNSFCSQSLRLLPFDIINYLHLKGISCFGDNCCRFLESMHSCNLDEKKISNFLSSIESNFTQEELININKKINLNKRSPRFKIKGHFLTNGVINFIKNIVKNELKNRPTLSNNEIYSSMVNCIKPCESMCEDRASIIQKINDAISELTI